MQRKLTLCALDHLHDIFIVEHVLLADLLRLVLRGGTPNESAA